MFKEHFGGLAGVYRLFRDLLRDVCRALIGRSCAVCRAPKGHLRLVCGVSKGVSWMFAGCSQGLYWTWYFNDKTLLVDDEI